MYKNVEIVAQPILYIKFLIIVCRSTQVISYLFSSHDNHFQNGSSFILVDADIITLAIDAAVSEGIGFYPAWATLDLSFAGYYNYIYSQSLA